MARPAPVQIITPELRHWISNQLEAGDAPASLLAAMQGQGWNAGLARAALAEVQARRAASAAAQPAGALGGAAGGASVGVLAGSVAGDVAGGTAMGSTTRVEPKSGANAYSDAAAKTTAHAAQARKPGALPEPSLDDGRNIVIAQGHAVQIALTMRHPRVVVFDNLLSAAECAALIEEARPRLERSQTVDNATGGSEVNAARTSDGMFFSRGESPLITLLEARIAALLNWPVENGEGLQILRYRPGAEYRPHYDYFDPAHPGSTPILKRGGQRLATLVMYLQEPLRGGATTFPDVALEVAPKRGSAVFFSYDRPSEATRTLHGGAPVLEGEKWVATKWLREGVFV